MVAVAVLAIATVAACSAGSSTSSSDSGYATEVAAAPPVVDGERNAASPLADVAGGEMGAAAGDIATAEGEIGSAGSDLAAPMGGSEQAAVAPVAGSQVIKTADLSIKMLVEPVPVTDDAAADREANAAARAAAITQATASVRGIASTAGGFQSSADGGGSVIAISLRVPAEQYDAVIDKLAALGELTNRIETSQDVTAEVIDVNSRVDTMTASVARVRALLAEATDIADVIAIESELAVREANLEALQQQQAYLSGQVALSTVSLTLTAVTDAPAGTEPVEEQSGFVAGLQSGWAALLGFFGWIGGAIGAVLPFVPVVAALGLLIWWLVRRVRRPRPGSAGAAPAAGNTGPTGPERSDTTPPAGSPANERAESLTPAP